MGSEIVILVDKRDNMLGTMEKIAAHRAGKLHRAFSVFIFNSEGELLLQQRALHKYHSAGKWSNACCSHPRPGEENISAAKRRLKEEMGLACELVHGFNFIYKADVGDGLYEHEFDHVFFGTTDTRPLLDPLEVVAYKFISPEDLQTQLSQNPDEYTEWFKICFDRVIEHNYLKQEND
ncbi:MAG: isopentenyl-diphosphate Delta-isomerase [Mucilaginibacter sp.]